jgi:hypothetical protein
MCGGHFGEGEHHQSEPIIGSCRLMRDLGTSRDVVEPIDFVDSRSP